MSRKPKPDRTKKESPASESRGSRRSSANQTHPAPDNGQPHFVIKRIRDGFFDRPESLDQAVASRIYKAIEDFHTNEGPTPTISKWYLAVSHMPALTELSEELDLLADCTFSYVVSGARMTPSPEALRRILLVRFLASLVDSDGWYPARWYESQYGLPPARLRQWVRRRKLTSRKRASANGANQTVYPFAGVKALASEVILDLAPQTSVTKRDKRDNA